MPTHWAGDHPAGPKPQCAGFIACCIGLFVAGAVICTPWRRR
jgi:hypothetical protein